MAVTHYKEGPMCTLIGEEGGIGTERIEETGGPELAGPVADAA